MMSLLRVVVTWCALATTLAVAAGVASAQSGPDDDRFVLEGVGPGRCFPEVAIAGSVVECRFPLIGRVQQPADWQGAVTVDQSSTFDDDPFLQPSCRFARTEIWCPHIPAFFDFGTSDVSLNLEGESRQLASFEVVDQLAYPISGTLVGTTEPVAFPGRPLTVIAWRNQQSSDASAWVAIRQRLGGRGDDPFRTVDIVPIDLPSPGSFESMETQIEAPSVPGRYVAVLCEGPTENQCSMLPAHHPFQVIDPALTEVVDGHNREDAGRINLVFVGSEIPSDVDFTDVVDELLTIDQPRVLRFDDTVVPLSDDIEPADVIDVYHGPFAVEPLRSEIERFNLWLLDDELIDGRALFHNADPEFSRDDELAGFDLPNTSIVTVHHQGPGRTARSESWWTGFRGREDVPLREELEFAGVYLAADARWPVFAARTLTHELGHALFDLRDEYSESGRDVQFGYPNCADGVEQAEAWWGDRAGELDPFALEYLDTLERLELYVPDGLIEGLSVGLEGGGCYAGDGRAVRPTADSVMNSEVPVFGAVNRDRVEEILRRFSPRVVLTSTDDVKVRCFPATESVPDGDVRCSGELARFVDSPVGALRLSLGEQSVVCSIDQVDQQGVRGVSCPDLITNGQGPWTITVSIGNGETTVVTRLVNAAVPEPDTQPGDAGSDPVLEIESAQSGDEPTPTSEVGVVDEPTNPVAGDGSLSVPVAIAAALAAFLLIGLGGYWFSRQGRRD